jgi:polyhydroxyalkanoate synthase subunit PhaC
MAPDDLPEQAAQHTLAANPLVGVRGRDILDSARLLLEQTVRNPGAAARAYLGFLGDLARFATGRSALAPGRYVMEK